MISKIFNSKEQSVLKWGVIIFGGALIWRALSKRSYTIKNPDGTEIIRVGKVEPEPATSTGTTPYNTEDTVKTGFYEYDDSYLTQPGFPSGPGGRPPHSSGMGDRLKEIEREAIPVSAVPVVGGVGTTEPIVDYAGPPSGSPYNTNN